MSNECEKEEIRRKYRQEDNSDKIFIPAKPKMNPFEKTGSQRVCAYCRVSTDNMVEKPFDPGEPVRAAGGA